MNDDTQAAWIENLTYDELAVGASARLLRTLTLADIQAFAAVSGDTNPAHLDADYANATLFHGIIAHGMWGASLISALLGTEFPGPGTIYLAQALNFSRPVRVGDTLTVTATVTNKDDAKKAVELMCVVDNQNGVRVLSGTARVLAPTVKLRLPRPDLPRIQLFDPEARFRELLKLAQGMPAARCAVVHPCEAETLASALDAASRGLIDPVLVAPEGRLRQVAEEAALDLRGIPIVDTPHSHASADAAAELALNSQVEMLMKGSRRNGELLDAVQARSGLMSERRMSHIYRYDVPMYAKPLLITDAAFNFQPTLEVKADIVRNAIDFAHLLGIERPKVALLAAQETVASTLPSTLDAAALCGMARRGQIRGGTLDGPLGLDNAISAAAALAKNVTSPVAGDPDVLVVPDLESGAMLTKQLEHLSGATGSGLIVGARVPISLSGRADGPNARIASLVLALLQAHNARRDHPRQRWVP